MSKPRALIAALPALACAVSQAIAGDNPPLHLGYEHGSHSALSMTVTDYDGSALKLSLGARDSAFMGALGFRFALSTNAIKSIREYRERTFNQPPGSGNGKIFDAAVYVSAEAHLIARGDPVFGPRGAAGVTINPFSKWPFNMLEVFGELGQIAPLTGQYFLPDHAYGARLNMHFLAYSGR
jgi:hypothetical protein